MSPTTVIISQCVDLSEVDIEDDRSAGPARNCLGIRREREGGGGGEGREDGSGGGEGGGGWAKGEWLGDGSSTRRNGQRSLGWGWECGV